MLRDVLESKPCLLCGGHDVAIAYSFAANAYRHEDYETASWDARLSIPLTIVRCRRCDLLYSRPSFRADALRHVYPDDLAGHAPSFSVALEQSRPKHAALLAHLRHHLATGSVCDIGTRYGVLPHMARSEGYDAVGIEYSPASVAVAQAAGVPVFQGTAEDTHRILTSAGRQPVDAFVLDDVLEHLVNPRVVLATLRECQRAGGLLLLRQMDLNSLGHLLFRRHWYYLQPAAHMYYFSERTLRELLVSEGYMIVDVIRPKRFENLWRTATRTVPGSALRWAKAVVAPGRHTKPSYLTRRLRSADDMFLVVARRR